MMERDSLAAVLKKETVHCFDVIVMVRVELESSMFPQTPLAVAFGCLRNMSHTSYLAMRLFNADLIACLPHFVRLHQMQ